MFFESASDAGAYDVYGAWDGDDFVVFVEGLGWAALVEQGIGLAVCGLEEKGSVVAAKCDVVYKSGLP